MAQPDTQNSGGFGSARRQSCRADTRELTCIAPEGLTEPAVAAFVLGAPERAVTALGGIDGETLRLLLDDAEPAQCGRRALFLGIAPAPMTELIVEQVVDLLAETARRLWPVWYTDVSFGSCRNNTLGRLASGVIIRSAAQEITGLSPSWAESAVLLALDNRPPRVGATHPAIELAQLALAISRSGLVLVAEMEDARNGPNPPAVVHALEWIAQHSGGAVIALFPRLPPKEPPFDRILYGARLVAKEVDVEPCASGVDATAASGARYWLAPWRGLPHPLSDTEQRLAKALGADAELASVFGFNQTIDTLRGSRPRVDLVWTQGRLVVELDGYESHGNRAAFMHDRHRDYELALSGYTVLRLANDEVAQDIVKAVEKIRDLVRLCRARAVSEG
jgi:very-short-patch-repair endonuclease